MFLVQLRNFYDVLSSRLCVSDLLVNFMGDFVKVVLVIAQSLFLCFSSFQQFTANIGMLFLKLTIARFEPGSCGIGSNYSAD